MVRRVVSHPFREWRPERMPLARLLPWVGSALTRYHQYAAAEHGLTPTSMGVLEILRRHDKLSHRDLAARLGLTPGTLTAVVDALEAAGHVRRERDRDDRRIVRLAITPAGHERVRTASAQVARRLRQTLPDPPPEQADIIRAYLVAVLAAVTDGDGR